MKKNFLFSDYTIGAVLTCLVLSLFYFQSPIFENMELMLYDARAKLRQQIEPGKRGEEVVIVSIDDESINKIGRWPWPRWRMAELINQLNQYEPKVIGFNILFSEPEGNQGLEEIRALQGVYGSLILQKKIREPKDYSFLTELSSAEVKLDNDTKVINAVRDSGKILLAMSFGLGGTPQTAAPAGEEEEEMPLALAMSTVSAIQNPADEASFPVPEASEAGLPIDEYAENSLGAGHVTVEPDVDGVLRREIPLVKFYGKYYPSFALQAVRTYLGLPLDDIKITLGQNIQIGKTTIPLDQENSMAISYIGGAQSFPYYSFYDVVNQKVQPQAFKNKIVIVAFTASGLGSLYTTPVATNFPGAEYIANVIQNILRQNFIVKPSWSFGAELGMIILVGLFITLLLPRLKAGAGFASALVLGILLIAPAMYLFKQGLWIKLVYPFFLLILGYIVIISKKFFTTEKSKELSEASEIETNKMLGLSFQGQGNLDLAFEKFRKCPMDDAMKELLYNLALDFERKRQFNKAVAVYEYVGKTDPKFKDIATKIDILRKAAEGAVFGSSLGGGKMNKEGTVVIDAAAAKPMLGRYEIIKELGRGAMGVVYLGKDPKINRTVAIKTMMFDDEVDEATMKELKERFFREAESAGNLSHPNIVKIFDAGEDQDMAYIAMELMEGDDLKKWTTKDTLLTMPQVMDFIAKVADALDYAHQQGVVHRDIKPANIMILKDGTVRVADFGIARIQGSSKTATGTVMGTPSYMSPEQIAGKKVDGRSDIFSLGVTLYELLTGEKPFKGGEAIGTLLFQIANDPHPDARAVRADIPAEAVDVINKALTKDPEKRYQKGGEMAKDLRACLGKISGGA